MSWAVAVSDLRKTYPWGEGSLEVLKGLSFSMAEGDAVAVVGESGSGKSTLLHILGALDTPSGGHVRVGGHDPFQKSDKAVSAFRNRHIGFVFQHNNLLPEFNAVENVMMPGLIAGFPVSEVKQHAEHLLNQVSMQHRLHHLPSQLSGGEQQRVAIARALINRPLLLLADEPSGNLDSHNAENIHGIFRALNHDLKTTLLVVTHNFEFARTMPRRLEMRDGIVVNDVRT